MLQVRFWAYLRAFQLLSICRVRRFSKRYAVLDDHARTEHLNRIKELQEFISAQPSGIAEFDETLVKHLLAKVTVYEEKLVFEFKSGVTVEVES